MAESNQESLNCSDDCLAPEYAMISLEDTVVQITKGQEVCYEVGHSTSIGMEYAREELGTKEKLILYPTDHQASNTEPKLCAVKCTMCMKQKRQSEDQRVKPCYF